MTIPMANQFKSTFQQLMTKNKRIFREIHFPHAEFRHTNVAHKCKYECRSAVSNCAVPCPKNL